MFITEEKMFTIPVHACRLKSTKVVNLAFNKKMKYGKNRYTG